VHVNTVSFKADSSNAKLSIPSLASRFGNLVTSSNTFAVRQPYTLNLHSSHSVFGCQIDDGLLDRQHRPPYSIDLFQDAQFNHFKSLPNF
jgi:hypothetical protein